MKVRFYSVQDLYDEVKDFPKRFPHLKSIPAGPRFKPSITDEEKVVRMQFLESTYTQEYRGKGDSTYIPVIEFTLTLSVFKPPHSSVGKGTLYYYSQPYAKCQEYELKNKLEAIVEGGNKLEFDVKETFEGWTVKKGVYEIE